jgi:hypothetical protein
MTPGLDVAEPCPNAIGSEGDHRLSFAHLILNVFGASLSDTRSSGLGGGFHFIADNLGKILVRIVGYENLKVFLLVFHCFNMNKVIMGVNEGIIERLW